MRLVLFLLLALVVLSAHAERFVYELNEEQQWLARAYSICLGSAYDERIVGNASKHGVAVKQSKGVCVNEYRALLAAFPMELHDEAARIIEQQTRAGFKSRFDATATGGQ